MNRIRKALLEDTLMRRQEEFIVVQHQQELRQITILNMMHELNLLDNVVVGPWIMREEPNDE